MKLFYVISVPDFSEKEPCETGVMVTAPVIRAWWADDDDHAEEQHCNAFPEERISWILEAPPSPEQ